ncbi:uncharacterized protein LOC141621208 [Silene latifolia]|uniref:uncharacterized protein LOC141621208 n=1 Tax=Silene latifolia TaxID=37657 RepID=UPI003D7818B9
MFVQVAVPVAVAVVVIAYKALKPPPPKICGTPGGPPVTSPRIKLKDGRYLAYREAGVSKDEAAYKIVFIHGFNSSKFQSLPVSQGIVEELKLYFLYFDRAGYGESDPNPKRSVKSEAFDIQELADALQLGSRFYVIGTSLGGYAAWSCLYYIPHRLAGMALVVPFIHYWWPKIPRELSRRVIRMLPDVSDRWTFRVAHYVPWLFYWWMTQKWFPTLSFLSGGPSVFTQSDLKILKKLSKDPQKTQQGVYESLYRDIMVGYASWEFGPLDVRNPFPDNNGKGRVHLWQGYEDKIIPDEMNRYITKQVPWIKYHEVFDGGHLFIFEQHKCDLVIKALVLG